MRLPSLTELEIEVGPGVLHAWSCNVKEQAMLEANGYERHEHREGDYALFIKGPIGPPEFAKKKATRRRRTAKPEEVPTSESQVNVHASSTGEEDLDDLPVAGSQ